MSRGRTTSSRSRRMSKMSLLPYVRYEQYDTQHEVPTGYARNPANDIDALTVGIAYKPIDRLVFKADWQQRKTRARRRA